MGMRIQYSKNNNSAGVSAVIVITVARAITMLAELLYMFENQHTIIVLTQPKLYERQWNCYTCSKINIQ